MKKWIKIILLVFVGFGFTTCVKNNPAPSWIEINPFKIEKNPILNNKEGNLNRNAIKHGWLYIDEQYIGVFELPCKVPILKSGKVAIRIFPAIDNNGVAVTKVIYPFLNSHTEIVTLIQNQTITITPHTSYLSGTTFWVEDFQESTIKFTDGVDTKTSLLTEVDNGNTVGRVILTPSENRWSAYISFDISDQKPFVFPLGSKVYLEFECKNTHPIKTFCTWQKNTGQTGSEIYYGSASSDSWKKIYIDYTDIVNYSGASRFWFGFISDLPPNDPQATILIDNVKIVYR